MGTVTAGGGRHLQARGAARARAAERAATRARVLGNIEQSRRARASSNFGEHATRERAAAAAWQGNSGPAKDLYTRPSGFRRGVRDQVWEQNRGPDGQVRDPGTGQVINKGQPWDMGHKPGYEFRKHRVSAQERGITRTQFLDEHNDPSHYRPELPSSNRNHAGEDHTDTWFGP